MDIAELRQTDGDQWSEDGRKKVLDHLASSGGIKKLVRVACSYTYRWGLGDAYELAQEVVNDKLAEFFRKRNFKAGNYSGKNCPIMSYLSRTVGREALRRAKREKARKAREVPLDDKWDPNPDDSRLGDDLDFSALKEKLNPILEELRPTYRNAYVLCVREELSYEEAAEKASKQEEKSIKANLMKTRKCRAIQEIKQAVARRERS